MSGRRQDLRDIPIGADWTLTVRMSASTSGWTVTTYFLTNKDDDIADALDNVSGTSGQGTGNTDIVHTVTEAMTKDLPVSKIWYSTIRTDTNARDRLVWGQLDLTAPRATDGT